MGRWCCRAAAREALALQTSATSPPPSRPPPRGATPERRRAAPAARRRWAARGVRLAAREAKAFGRAVGAQPWGVSTERGDAPERRGAERADGVPQRGWPEHALANYRRGERRGATSTPPPGRRGPGGDQRSRLPKRAAARAHEACTTTFSTARWRPRWLCRVDASRSSAPSWPSSRSLPASPCHASCDRRRRVAATGRRAAAEPSSAPDGDAEEW